MRLRHLFLPVVSTNTLIIASINRTRAPTGRPLSAAAPQDAPLAFAGVEHRFICLGGSFRHSILLQIGCAFRAPRLLPEWRRFGPAMSSFSNSTFLAMCGWFTIAIQAAKKPACIPDRSRAMPSSTLRAPPDRHHLGGVTTGKIIQSWPVIRRQ